MTPQIMRLEEEICAVTSLTDDVQKHRAERTALLSAPVTQLHMKYFHLFPITNESEKNTILYLFYLGRTFKK